jgi:hypothetical protein
MCLLLWSASGNAVNRTLTWRSVNKRCIYSRIALSKGAPIID